MAKVGIIDTHVCNLKSVYGAVTDAGFDPCIIDSPHDFNVCSHVIIPGVGSFSDGMAHLHENDLISGLLSHIRQGKPTLGICLGMHLLAEQGDEFGFHAGISVIQAKVKRLIGKNILKLPHVGWNQVKHNSSILFHKIPNNSLFYFAHSYALNTDKKILVSSTSQYESIKFIASIQHENIYAVQFHPEKSHGVGTQLLQNFVNLC